MNPPRDRGEGRPSRVEELERSLVLERERADALYQGACRQRDELVEAIRDYIGPRKRITSLRDLAQAVRRIQHNPAASEGER